MGQYVESLVVGPEYVCHHHAARSETGVEPACGRRSQCRDYKKERRDKQGRKDGASSFVSDPHRSLLILAKGVCAKII
jgi:hypothetical protein